MKPEKRQAAIDRLNHLRDRVREIEKVFDDALRKTFPDGTRVFFKKRHNQITPSHGTVINAWGGSLRVRMPKRKYGPFAKPAHVMTVFVNEIVDWKPGVSADEEATDGTD